MPWVRTWVPENTVRCKDCESEVQKVRQIIIENAARLMDADRDSAAARAAKLSGWPMIDTRRQFIFYARNFAEPKMTLQAIADCLDIGKERVRQLEKDVMKKMRRSYTYYMAKTFRINRED